MCKLKNKLLHYIVFLCLLVISTNTFAQSKKDLEEKRKKLQKEIQLTNQLLIETSKNKELSLDELLKLKSKINARSNLIYTMNAEVKLINNEITQNKEIIVNLNNNLTLLKKEYAQMIYAAFKHKNTSNKMMFVLASSNFNQAYKRIKYIQQYSEYRKSQAQSILKTQLQLNAKIEALNKIKKEKSNLISIQKSEQVKLSNEKKQQESVVNQLQNKEQDLKDKLKKKQAAEKKLQKAIYDIIAEEIRKARDAAKNAGKSSTGFPMTPEALKLSNSFANNKGKLPWPVKQGVITDRFGKHPHPVLEGIVVNNNGIDISTSKGATARAIFSGEVSSVAIIPGEGKVVMIRHGEYLSVYSYMTEVFVSKGDKITTKQELGLLVSEKDKSKTQVHLEIWKGMTKLNPEYWITR